MIVAIHGAGPRVRGKAREYQYFVASLFVAHQKKDGDWVWRNSGRYVGPFRSLAKTKDAAQRWATELGAEFVSGRGSWHNKAIDDAVTLLKAAAFNLE